MKMAIYKRDLRNAGLKTIANADGAREKFFVASAGAT
jgi:hypothetical protein